MSNLFAGVYGAKFPEVVMNSGPLPPEGGLPAPLHDTPDARINYGATLLGDLQPYAYGEAGFMSSQSQNNQPHRIQKIIPELYLPEPNGKDVFRLSHAVDDSDLAFVMRLNRNSIFCTGSRTSTRRNTKIGTTVDPIINLATLNYLLAGLQLSKPAEPGDGSSLWWEFLHNLDPSYWPKAGEGGRNYSTDTEEFSMPDEMKARLGPHSASTVSVFEHHPFCLSDIVHVIRHCVKPFGIVRGSERQGGQHEMSAGAATWTTSAIATLVIDGKEANVVNIWHHEDIHAGDDLVLRLKIMPVKTYTLNHYFKGFARKSYDVPPGTQVWQLIPDVFNMEGVHEYPDPGDELRDFMESISFDNAYKDVERKGRDGLDLTEADKKIIESRVTQIVLLTTLRGPVDRFLGSPKTRKAFLNEHCVLFDQFFPQSPHFFPWQQIGFWHIGRCQVMRPKYGEYVFYNDDMANGLKTNHIDMTFQPTFSCFPRLAHFFGLEEVREIKPFTLVGKKASAAEKSWEPQLQLERMQAWVGEPAAKRAHGLHDGFGPRAQASAFDHQCGSLAKTQDQRSPWDVETDQLDASEDQRSAWDIEIDRLRAKRNQRSPWDAEIDKLKAQRDQRSAWDIEIERLKAKAVPCRAPAIVLDAEDGPAALGSGLPEPSLASGPAPPAADAVISEASRQELLGGLGAPKKTARTTGKGRKTGDATAARGPVEGTLLRPGAEPEACHMELL